MVSAFSIGTAKRGELASNPQHRQVPGPGAYTPVKNQKKIPPSWKIGSGQRAALQTSKTPGPGTYQHKQKVGNEGAKYSIALKSWKDSQVMKNPGPGAYNPMQKTDSKKASAPNYSMGSRTLNGDFIQVKKTPGPGTYEKKSTVTNRPSSKFGTGKRQDLSQSGYAPGPGAYFTADRPASAKTTYVSSRYQDGPKFGFGSQVRDEFYNSGKNPGPGTYTLKSSFDNAKGVTMISRRSMGNSYNNPGPGSYNPDKKQKFQPPSFKIGSGQRAPLSQSQKFVPGPGTYASNLYNRPKSPHYKIGTDVRRPLSGYSSTPGVGTYSFRQNTDGPKFSMKGNVTADPVEREKQRVPGPGTYKPSVQQTKVRPQSAKIGTGNRQGLYQKNNVPGPGIYDAHNKPQGPKWGMGSSGRSAFKDNKVPGVGSYQLKPYFADVPAYLIPRKAQ